MPKLLKLTLCIMLTLLIGGLGGIATAGNVTTWYPTLNKPFFNPPNYLFGPVWTLLYSLMGISLYLILQAPKSPIKSIAILFFAIQLVLNFCWSFLFFKYHLLGFALIEIVALWIVILWMILAFKKINKKAGNLQWPYLVWVAYATILNASLWWLN